MDDPFFRELEAALDLSKRLEAEVEDMEHMRKVVLAQDICAQGSKSKAMAEEVARAGERYRTFLRDLAAKRQEAAKASARAEYLKMRFEGWRTVQANRRAKEHA